MSNDSTYSRTILKDLIPLPIPICVYIDVTNKCNFTCPLCPTGNRLQRKISNNIGVMKMSLFKKIVEDFKVLTRNKRKRVKIFATFFMGESLLHKNYFEMVKIAKEADIANKIIVSTNGSLLAEDTFEKIIASGLDILTISMYGCSNEDYKKVSKRFSFDMILDNSKRLIEYREKKGSKTPTVILKYFENTKEVQDVRDRLLNCCDDITFEEPFNWNATYTQETGTFISRKVKSVKYCSQPWYVMSIGWDGSVLVCCADWTWSTNVGNVTENSVEDIWCGEGYLLFRQRIVQGFQDINSACNGCNAYQNADESSYIDDLINTNPEKALKMP